MYSYSSTPPVGLHGFFQGEVSFMTMYLHSKIYSELLVLLLNRREAKCLVSVHVSGAGCCTTQYNRLAARTSSITLQGSTNEKDKRIKRQVKYIVGSSAPAATELHYDVTEWRHTAPSRKG